MENDAQKIHNELSVREKQPIREQGTHSGLYFQPPVDIYETEEAIVAKFDVPGAETDAIQTDVKDYLLTLTARVAPIDTRWKLLHDEYQIGNYSRQFRLGQQIDQNKITAELKDGVLTLTLPKAEAAKPRRIQIKAA